MAVLAWLAYCALVQLVSAVQVPQKVTVGSVDMCSEPLHTFTAAHCRSTAKDGTFTWHVVPWVHVVQGAQLVMRLDACGW